MLNIQLLKGGGIMESSQTGDFFSVNGTVFYSWSLCDLMPVDLHAELHKLCGGGSGRSQHWERAEAGEGEG